MTTLQKKKFALEIVKQLRKHGFQAYFAGGCVRDMVMKKTPGDYDIATDAAPGQLKKIFKRTVFVGAQFGTVLVVKNGIAMQVTTFRGHDIGEFSKDPETDASNRDFTINGLLYNPLKKNIMDYVGGKADIKKRSIRCIQDPHTCFRQDGLRILRAVRFSSVLNFKIEKKTFEAIKKFSPWIAGISKERVRDELVKIVTGKNPRLGMELLDKTGILGVLLPEIEALKGVEQPPKFHPEGDVFTHTMLLMKGLKNADTVLAFACLLHDVGKPATYAKTDRIRFNNHDKVGANIAEGALKRLRFSNGDIRKIIYCIDNHMRIMNAMRMRESTLKQMFLKDTFETELELHRLDCMASHGDLKIYRFLKRRYEAFKKTPQMPRPVLNGHEIMAMGFKEGPVIGRIQKAMVAMQLEGRIKSKGKAKAWLCKRCGVDKKQQVKNIISLLKKEYPAARIALEFHTPMQMLASTILSAQCTDERVNKVTAELFKKYKTPRDFAGADLKNFEGEIRSTGFYKNKARNIINSAGIITEKFKGRVPDTMEGLLTLPGVARKTANVVLQNAFGKVAGIVVDTHVIRLSGRLGLTKNKDPVKIENDLMEITPGGDWGLLSYLLIDHGRKICHARKPNHAGCVLRDICPSRNI